MEKNSMFSKVIDKMVANFVPQEDDEARLSLNGVVVVKTQTPTGKEFVDANSNIYPEEMLSKFPVFTIAKPVAQVQVGDIVKLTKSTFATVTEIKNGKVETVSFGGQHREAKAFKDMFLGQATVRVVVNPLAGMGGDTAGNTLMMLSMLDKDGDDKSDLIKTMMLSSCLTGAGQNPFGAMTANPLMMFALMGDKGGNIQDIMMMQAMQSGGFATMFGGIAPVAQAPVAQAPVADQGADNANV